jgi:GAF domain-containing protein
LERKIVHIPDVEQEPRYTFAAAYRASIGIRTYLGVPMLRDGNPIGAIALYRGHVALFSDREIELVKAFADQAVIAIENTRLLNELRESLQQQTATSDVLQVISGSPGELEPVFEAMLKNATNICEAKFGMLYLWEGEGQYRVAALHGAPPSAGGGAPPRSCYPSRACIGSRAGHVDETYGPCCRCSCGKGLQRCSARFHPAGH